MNTPQRKRFKILLVGDQCLDVYQYGWVDRLSPEAPVPVFRYSHQELKPGMTGNVLANLEALECNVTYTPGGESSTKTRLIDIRSKQQIVRIDNDIPSKPINVDDVDLTGQHAVVISDYNKGSITYEFVQEIRKRYRGPIFIDTKKTDLAKFEGCWVKINEAEYKACKTVNSTIVVTLGNRGAMLKADKSAVDTFYPTSKVEVADVCGAGDTFLAALAYKFLESGKVEDAIQFANRAALLTVQHIGNYAPTLEEIGCKQD